MICIEILESGECRRIGHEIWITANRNGPVVTPHRCKAKGVGDGTEIWSLGGLDGYPQARIITMAQYEEHRNTEEDPELSAEEALAIILGGSYESE